MNDREALYTTFRERAEAVGAEVHRASSVPAVKDLVANIVLWDVRPKSIAAVPSELTALAGLSTVAARAGAVLHTDGWRTNAAAADLGISEVDLAVAETGTLVQDATDIGKRLVSMLPPVHLALVRTGSLVGTLREALSHIPRPPDGPPGYLAFISGPSRTADIERVLTIGVHGPGRVIIVFVDDAPQGGEPR